MFELTTVLVSVINWCCKLAHLVLLAATYVAESVHHTLCFAAVSEATLNGLPLAQRIYLLQGMPWTSVSNTNSVH